MLIIKKIGLNYLLFLPFMAILLSTQIFSALPTDLHALTLKEAIFLALRNNPTVQSAELDRIVQRYALVVAQNPFQLNYKLQAAYSNQASTSDGFFTRSSSFNIQPAINWESIYGTQVSLSANNPKIRHGNYNPSLNLQIIQPLIRGFGREVVEANLRNAFDQELINRLNLKNQIATTIDTIISDYLLIIQAQESLKIDQSSLKTYEQDIIREQRMIDLGSLPSSDLIQVKAQLANQQIAVQEDRNTIHSDLLKLLNDLGLESDTRFNVPPVIDFKDLVWQILGKHHLPSIEQCQTMALENNLIYQASVIALRQIKRNVIQAEDENRWTLNLEVNQTVGNGTGGGDNAGVNSLFNHKNDNRTVNLNLQIPINDVAAKQSLLQAKVALAQADILLKASKRKLETDTHDLRNTVLSLATQWRLSQEALELAKKNVIFATMKQKAGRISTFEWLNIQNDLTRAEQAVISNAINYINALANFENLLGATLDHWDLTIRT